jgi:hypothetical protein
LKNGNCSTNNAYIGSEGGVGIRKTPFGEAVFLNLYGLPLLFQRPKSDKVELKHLAKISCEGGR